MNGEGKQGKPINLRRKIFFRITIMVFVLVAAIGISCAIFMTRYHREDLIAIFKVRVGTRAGECAGLVRRGSPDRLIEILQFLVRSDAACTHAFLERGGEVWLRFPESETDLVPWHGPAPAPGTVAVRELKGAKGDVIYDVAADMGGGIGILHAGLSGERIDLGVNSLLAVIALLCLGCLTVGAGLAHLFSGRATREVDILTNGLRVSEEKFKKAFDQSPAWVILASLDDLRYIEVNEAFLRATGYNRDEVIGRTSLELDTWVDPGQRLEMIRLINEAGSVRNMEVERRMKDGTVLTMLLSAEQIEIGGESCILSLSVDISGLKAAEQALAIHQQQALSIFDSIDEVIYVADTDTYEILFANKALKAVLNKELVGGTCYRELQGLEAPCPFCTNEIIKKKAGEPYRWEYHNPIVDQDFLVTDRMVKWPDGREVRFEIAMNITERVKAEAERKMLLSAIEHTNGGIVITDPEGTIQYVNPAFERITGYPRDEMVGQNPRILKSGRQDEAFYRELWETITSGETWKGRFINRRRDGGLYTEAATISPVLDERGKVTNFVAVKRDITDRLKLESQLQQAQKMEAIGTLAGGIAHDFNNILAAIIGLSELSMMEVSKGSSLHAHLEKIFEAGMRAKDLVQQILAFSRQKNQERIPMSMDPVVNEALKFLRSSVPSTIQINCTVEKDAGLILGDPTQMHQVVMNLCANAEHAMRETGGTLDISVKRVDVDGETASLHHNLEPGPHVLLEVKDTGYGIERENLERIFDPYFTTKGVGEGTGLGLAVVRGIVHKHGGAIGVKSEVGKGTCFEVFFPLFEGDREEPEEESEGPLPTGNERILFIDDEEVLARLGKEILEQLGYQVSVRTSSPEALELFKKRPDRFDAVITDMSMPGMTGAELSRKIMEIRPDIPVILCTGFSHVISREKALEMGIGAFVMKPLVRKDLAETVRKVLDSVLVK